MLWVDCSIEAMLCHQNFFFFQHIFQHIFFILLSALPASQLTFYHSVKDFIPWDRLGHALSRERIAKLLRYCWIMHTMHRNELPRMAGQGEPRHGRRVSTVSSSIVKLKGIIPTVSWQCSVAHVRGFAQARTHGMKPCPTAGKRGSSLRALTQRLLPLIYISLQY